MKWLMVLVGLLMVVLLLACGSDTDNGDQSPQPAYEQRLYDAFLDQARSDLRSTGPDLFCEPDYWLLVAEQVDGATGGEKTILQLAMGDACKEAGHLSEAARYSPYYR